ncbi:GntR family transcriptional regulator [Bordetella sp. BOR01]|uniref:GntR family transcriptional regulator n=1 Tax=Bordetella sp. BOR01 TaxID=2854779 RepID=UPI001C4970C1|nr:GntR family transcriptional regulator [Bordetella sp. BOR01]MBV7482173.1 GntR family transcriptional regulator [Bordetella sp. BOR01]
MAGHRASQVANAPSAADTRSGWKEIAETLELDIITGKLHLREHLVEDDLIKRFRASRYAVRRALDEMHALGLVVRNQNRGAYIRDYTAQEVQDLFGVREILESAAARQIPMPVSDDFLRSLASLQEQHDAAMREGDYFRLFSLNNAFHQTLFSACGNTALNKAIAHYSMQVQPIRMQFVHNENRRKQTSEEHWEMIEALKRGDSKALARVCVQHLSVTKQLFLKGLEGKL